MSWVLAIDPGPTESAWVILDEDTGRIVNWEKLPNELLLVFIGTTTADRLAVEMIASYGMPVGAEVFETCVWIGRFIERWYADAPVAFEYAGREPHEIVYRKDVKMFLCGTPRASDANVRQALIDRYGPGKEKAIGRKATPGPLYGLSGDGWAALGVAVTAIERWDDERPREAA